MLRGSGHVIVGDDHIGSDSHVNNERDEAEEKKELWKRILQQAAASPLHKKLYSLQAKLKSFFKDVKFLENRKEVLTEQAAHLKLKIDDARNNGNHLQEEQEETVEQRDIAEQVAETTNNKLDIAKQEEANAKERQIDCQKAEENAVGGNEKAMAARDLKAANNNVDMQTIIVKQLQIEATKNAQVLDGLNNKLEDINIRLEEQQAELKALEAQKAEVDANIDGIDTKLKQLRSDITQTKSEITVVENKIAVHEQNQALSSEQEDGFITGFIDDVMNSSGQYWDTIFGPSQEDALNNPDSELAIQVNEATSTRIFNSYNDYKRKQIAMLDGENIDADENDGVEINQLESITAANADGQGIQAPELTGTFITASSRYNAPAPEADNSNTPQTPNTRLAMQEQQLG